MGGRPTETGCFLRDLRERKIIKSGGHFHPQGRYSKRWSMEEKIE
jgi:hypothetical protein